uniref:Ataxin-2 C-terminal domain-containing protein n=1 Tax=Opuntia streptacantha TaxID=393608 RepID=A0A7C8YP81_OPUST
MALVSGRSTLNPNAPLYIPAAFRQVEDFSPEWWDLISTSMWFRNYWLGQHQETEIMYGNNENNFEGDDVVDLLPDDIDLGVDEELLNMESQFEEFIKFSGSQESKLLPKDGLVDAKIGSKLGMESQGKPAQKK